MTLTKGDARMNTSPSAHRRLSFMKALRLGDQCHLDYASEQMLMKTALRILDTNMMTTPKCVKNKNMAKFSHSLADFDDDCLYSFMNDEIEDHFYTNLNTPTLMPSEDIWKKFELLPTPPRSPKHDVSDFLDMESMSDISDFLPNSAVKPPNIPFPESPPSSLCSKLIQDCMWSGSHRPGLEAIGKSEKPGSPITESGRSENSHTGTASDCVDPAAVFPYPISDTRMTPLGTETPSDSEEEIDVVSTEDAHEVRIPSPEPMPINVKTVTVRTESVKREPNPVHVVTTYHDMDVHNYSLPHSHSFKRTKSSPCQTIIAPKGIKRELSEPDLKRVCQKLKASSRSSSRNNSDSEESGEGKRTQHNVLERKRRNDLKYSFFTLRDTVPELKEKEKAPKVLILRKSADYIYELRQKEVSLAKQVQNQKDKYEKLRRTLSSLRR